MRRARGWLVTLTLLALTAGACGGGDDEPEPGVALTAVPSTGAATTAPSSPTPTPAPTASATDAGGATPTPAPDVTPPASASVALTADDAYLQPTDDGVVLDHDDTATCSIVPHDELVIEDCVVVTGAGGTFAVLIAEFADTRHARLYALDDAGAAWEPVAVGPEYGPDASSDHVSFTPRATTWTFPWNVVLLEGLVGGSGAVSGIDIVSWEGGDAEPSVRGHVPERPGTSVADVAGVLLVENPNHSDGAPNCCPTLHDLRLIDLGTRSVTLWEGLAVDDVSPEFAALRYYDHRIAGEGPTASEYATAEVAAMDWPGPGTDTHLFHTCDPDGPVLRCLLQNEAGSNHLLVAPGGEHGWRVVDLDSFAD